MATDGGNQSRLDLRRRTPPPDQLILSEIILKTHHSGEKNSPTPTFPDLHREGKGAKTETDYSDQQIISVLV